jgi:KDO2-lipid IV(A) lauroyltransferase
MRHVLGPDAAEEAVEALARQAFTNIMKGHYDLFRVNRLTEEEILGLTRVDRWDRLDSALDRGKGVILVTAHFGNIDVVGQLPQAYGVPLTGPVEHIQPERLFQYTLKLRTSHGMRLIPADGPLMGLYRALKRGEIVGLPCDRALGDHTREIEFFGAPARLTDGPVRLAHRTGAALVPGFVLRLPDDTFLVQIEPEIELPRTGDREADVAAGMEMVVDAMERHISEHPEQWLVAVPVWPLD